MNILFPLEGTSQFHYFRSVIEAASRRGHRLRMVFGKGTVFDELLAFKKTLQGPGVVEWEQAVCRTGFWKSMLFTSRNMLSYRRYVACEDGPLYYKNRLQGYLPFWLRPFVKKLGADWLFKPAWVLRALRFVERVAPPDERIIGHIKEFNPDAVLVPSANLISSTPDLEYLKAARALGIPTLLVVMTWDSLENKGITNVFPDRFLVWNEIKADIARREHHVRAETIGIVGASQFDEWFAPHAPRMTRREFCKSYGLKEEHPIILYLCSSANIATDERWLIGRLRAAFDTSSSASVRNVQIVVRPHPLNAKHYQDFMLPSVAFGSRTGALPTTEEAFQVFYDELFYSTATIGINTSAMLEALIAGKPGITILEDRYQSSQAQTPYFRQLLHSGALFAVRSPEEAPVALRELFEGRDRTAENRKSFVADYIRPRGMQVVAGEAILEETERLVNNA